MKVHYSIEVYEDEGKYGAEVWEGKNRMQGSMEETQYSQVFPLRISAIYPTLEAAFEAAENKVREYAQGSEFSVSNKRKVFSSYR